MPKKIKGKLPQGGDRIKTPAPPQISSNDQIPMFYLGNLSKDYSVEACEQDDKAAFASALYKLSQLTWGQINQTPRHGLGSEKIERNSIKPGIPALVTEDVGFFIAFRFSGKKSMVGYRVDSVFNVIWLDHDFSVYNHG